MVKKVKSSSAKRGNPSVQDTGQLAQAVRDSAHQIWLAGLGAFQKAQDEGNKAFDKLVKEGNSLHKLTREVAEAKVAEVAGKVAKLQDNVSRQASGTWDKLEAVFESRVARALESLGVPTDQQITALHRRLDDLAAVLQGRPAAPKRGAAKAAAPAAKKAAPAKKTTAKKTTVKKAAPAKPAAPAAKTATRKTT